MTLRKADFSAKVDKGKDDNKQVGKWSSSLKNERSLFVNNSEPSFIKDLKLEKVFEVMYSHILILWMRKQAQSGCV